MAERSMPTGLKFVMKSNLVKLMQESNVWLYRKSGGKLGGRMKGAPILLLTTRGRKTGKQRVTPLIYLRRDSGELVVVASKGGWSAHPLWYGNLQADAAVQVQIGRDVRPMQARTAGPDERAQVWPELVRMFPDYAEYQSWSDREIPVVLLRAAA